MRLEPLHQFAPVLQQKDKNSDSDNDEQRELFPALQIAWVLLIIRMLPS